MHQVTLLGMQGFTQLPEAGSLRFPSQPYNFVERVKIIATIKSPAYLIAFSSLQTCSILEFADRKLPPGLQTACAYEF